MGNCNSAGGLLEPNPILSHPVPWGTLLLSLVSTS